MKRIFISILIIGVFGVLKLPFEKQLTEEHRAAFFHSAHLDLSLRQQLAQGEFIAALSGLRAPVADFLFIEAHSAWEDTQWGKVRNLFNAVTALQPRVTMFWQTAAWHMAWNASVAALRDTSEPHEALRRRTQREYFEIGKDFLIRGIQNNPDRYVLYEYLGLLYTSKLADHCAAAEQYKMAMQFKNAPTYEKRFYGYELAKCPGHEREAYEYLLKLYKEGENEWLPTLLTTLKDLQDKLNIPADQRVKIPEEKKH